MRVWGIALAVLLMGSAAMGQETSSVSSAPAPQPQPVTEVWNTDEGGAMTLQALPDSFDGTYENDNGRINGVLKDGVFAGFWGEDGSSQECTEEKLGTKYWGRIAFTFDAARKHFDGKWGYCDADPDSGWTGDLTGK
jgi:hypothetical protein